jgi:hypothetical protein
VHIAAIGALVAVKEHRPGKVEVLPQQYFSRYVVPTVRNQSQENVMNAHGTFNSTVVVNQPKR